MTALKPNLYYIRWTGVPSREEGIVFVRALANLLDNAEQPLYFISDLRRGYINNVEVVRRLGKTASHENWAGDVAFSRDAMSSLYVGVYSRFAPDEKPTTENEVFHQTADEAIAQLETLKPGLTQDIDWAAVLGPAPVS